MEWKSEVEQEDLTGFYGFLYRIDYTDGTYYFGKKSLVETRKKTFGKKELAKVTDKRLKTYHIITKESNWRKYEGSCKETTGKVIKDKTIIRLCRSKKSLTFRETELLFKKEVLTDDKCLNANIEGKYFKDEEL